MRVAVLTSSRADYYLYTPLLEKLSTDPFFDLNLIVFGSHLSKKYGYTVNDIKKDNFKIIREIQTLPKNDTPKAISYAIGETVNSFSALWEKEKFDLVFALGDRYEMFAAVSSSVPFSIKIAHIHGGETTLGSIDNVFRHCITLMSELHFTCALPYKKRVIQITGSKLNVYNVGALSMDNLRNITYYSIPEFKQRYQVDLSIPTILVTFHPETVDYSHNKKHIREIVQALNRLTKFQMVITMPNTDINGEVIRNEWRNFQIQNKNVFLFENLGKTGYLSCMKHSALVLGNSSSGFTESSYFPKPVVNIGNRQTGRIMTGNIINCEAKSTKILYAVNQAMATDLDSCSRVYGQGNSAEKIIRILKSIFGNKPKSDEKF